MTYLNRLIRPSLYALTAIFIAQTAGAGQCVRAANDQGQESEEFLLDHTLMSDEEIEIEVKRIINSKCVKCHSHRPPATHFDAFVDNPARFFKTIDRGRMPPIDPSPHFSDSEDGIFILNWLDSLIPETT